jgi:hypothetical protein
MTIPTTKLFDDLVNGVLNAAASDLGYSRGELNRITKDAGMDEELTRMMVDAMCRDVSRSASAWSGFARRTANVIADAVSAKEFDAGIKIDMTKGE